MSIYDTQIKNYAAQKNTMRRGEKNNKEIRYFPQVSFEEFMSNVPEVFWEGHGECERLYKKTWELAYRNIKHPTPQNNFISSYIDTAFNDCTFLWDSVFIAQFSKYARKCYDFMGMIDNFYCKQHEDGFICRQLGSEFGEDRFEKFDPTSTGPNLFAYCEWEYFKQFGDKDRLEKVFPVLVAYYRWFRLYRSWPDGSYWNSGWGCGLDNSPRFKKKDCLVGFDDSQGFDFYHGFCTWLDACVHQVMSGDILYNMAKLLGCENEICDITEECVALKKYINEKLWDEETGFYYDRDRNGKLSGVKTILAYWTLLAEIPDSKKVDRLVEHLKNKTEFCSAHCVPSLSMDSPYFGDDPIYWQGGTWAPTNYMIMQGLYSRGYGDLAHEIACNTLAAVEKVFQQTGTVWEYYHPVRMEKGAVARPDFVGWTGLIPISVLIEYVFGIHLDAMKREIFWEIRISEQHGVKNMPVFDGGTISLQYLGEDEQGEPVLQVESDTILTLKVRYKDRTRTYPLGGTTNRVDRRD